MSVAAVDRAVSLIEAMAAEADAQELSQLATRAGLPLSAAHRILGTLAERGLVVQEPATQNYRLSLRLAVLAFRSLEARAVPDVAQAALDRLAARTREYCRLAIAEGEDLVWVARAQGAPAGLRYEPDMGEEIVLHATANGKAWLAAMDEADARRILRARGLNAPRPLGPRAADDLDTVLAALREVRRKGYATAVEEAEAGTAAVAVTFRAGARAEAPVAGTISVAGPLTRVSPERFADLYTALSEAAADISEMWPIRTFKQSARPTSEAAG